MHPSVAIQTPAVPQNDTGAKLAPRLIAWQVTERTSHIPASLLRAAAIATDSTALLAAGVVSSSLLAASGSASALNLISLLATATLTAAATDLLGLGRKPALLAPLTTLASRLTLAIVIAFWIAASIPVIAGEQTVARPALALWMTVSVLTLLAARMALGTIARRWARQGRLERRAAIYGAGEACADLIASLESDPACDVRIAGICDDRGSARVGDSVMGYPRIGRIDDLIGLARRSRIDTIIVTVPAAADKRLLQILERLSVLPADVRQPAAASSLRLAPSAYSRIGNQPMLSMLDLPMGMWGSIAKSAMDKTIATLALIALSPILAAVAIAVKLDSRGPVLFRQKRYGFNNELIEVFKFRSMYIDQCDSKADKLVSKGDCRVTRVGRFIRKTSLDELPQLFNVLIGSLSLVGPRPHAVNAKAADRLYGDVVGRYFVRHKVKPGITGWAQINGWRGETDTEEKIVQRVAHDLHYIENWSLLLDLRILLSTPLALLKTDNAY